MIPREGPQKQFWGELPGQMKKVLMMGIIVSFFLGSSITVNAKCEHCTIQYNDGIPEEIRTDCEEVGLMFNICPEILESMAYRESRFIPTVTNGNHYGLMQVNVKIHAARLEKYGYTEEDMFDPYCNLVVAADYLAELYEMYGDENPIVLSVYSGNWKAVSRYKEYGHLSSYVEDVLTRSAEYERLHGK